MQDLLTILQSILRKKQNKMVIQIILHAILALLGFILLYKSVSLLKNFNKEKREMYFLTRKQVKHIVSALVLFGLVYIGLQFFLFFKGNFDMSPTFEQCLQYSNEALLIISLIYLIFKFKKKK